MIWRATTVQSLSQCGAVCTQALLIFISALVHVGVSTFSVIVFGEAVRIIKTEAEDWGPVAIATLLSQLRFEDFDSRDADAVECALDLLQSSASRGAKKVFVFTDGYGTSGLSLPRALQRAEEQDVQVVGVGVGFDRLCVNSSYQHWCTAALSSALPDAIRTLYTPSERPRDLPSPMSLTPGIMSGADGEKELDEIFRQQVKVFEGLTQMLSKEREATLQRGNAGAVTVDVCFVLDVTGSMRPFLKSVVNDIHAIATGIPNKIQQTHAGLKLQMRFGAVWFRDACDQDRLGAVPFSEDPAKLAHALAQVPAKGGGDLADDALGGLHHAATALEWQAKARFVVLMTDAPGHGYADAGLDDYPQGLDNRTAQTAMRSIGIDLGADFMFCRIRPDATARFEQELKRAFEDTAMYETAAHMYHNCTPHIACLGTPTCRYEKANMPTRKMEAVTLFDAQRQEMTK